MEDTHGKFSTGVLISP